MKEEKIELKTYGQQLLFTIEATNDFKMLKKLNNSISIKDLPCKQENRKMLYQQTESFSASRQLQHTQVQNELTIKKVLLITIQTKLLSTDRSGQFKQLHKRLSPAVFICHHLHYELQIGSISYLVCFPYRILLPSSCYFLGYDQILFN